MSKLTSEARGKLRTSQFAVPERRAFPINDKNHARAALMLINKAHSPGEKARIRSKANAMLASAKGGQPVKCMACGGTHARGMACGGKRMQSGGSGLRGY